MNFYISDTHFGDENVFQKCSRPFQNVEEGNRVIVENWNRRVSDEDDVYLLGDVAQDHFLPAISIIKKLKGHKHLIVGNHDAFLLPQYEESGLFETIDFIRVIDDEGRTVCLCHYPLMDWIEFNRGGWLVYGHIHNKTIKNGEAYLQIKQYYSDKPAFNCGVDVTGFEPKTLDELVVLKRRNSNEPYIN